MQSKTEDLLFDLETADTRKDKPRSFKLYEEYSGTSIEQTIRTRRDQSDTASPSARRELEEQVEAEVEDFRDWLVRVKNFDAGTAHFCSVSLKSLLIGIPVGTQVAELFENAMSLQGRR